MIFQGFFILLLHADVIQTPRKSYIQIPVEEANCYTRKNRIFCYHLEEVPNLEKYYFVDLLDSDLKLHYDLINFNHINNTFHSELTYFYNAVKNNLKLDILDLKDNFLLYNSQDTVLNTSTVKLHNWNGKLCLDNKCIFTKQVVATIISKHTEKDFLKIFPDNSIFACDIIGGENTYETNSKIGTKSLSELQTVEAHLADIKQIILEIKTLTISKSSAIDNMIELITVMQNKTDKDIGNILMQQLNVTKETKTRNVHYLGDYLGDLEIFFRISIFLMLFIIVFMFNIYFCSSIIYHGYKKRFVSLDR